MKRTSRGSRLVSSAARSPGRSSTGPEVWRRFTPISRAMMCASVVFPSPGGPKSSTWSSASPRARAAWMKISSWPRTFSCPTYSASVPGRSERSTSLSCADEGLAEMRRSVSTLMARLCMKSKGAASAAPFRRAAPPRSELPDRPEADQIDLGIAEGLAAHVDVALPFEAQAEVAVEVVAPAEPHRQVRIGLGLRRDDVAGALGPGAVQAELAVEREALGERISADRDQLPGLRLDLDVD